MKKIIIAVIFLLFLIPLGLSYTQITDPFLLNTTDYNNTLTFNETKTNFTNITDWDDTEDAYNCTGNESAKDPCEDCFDEDWDTKVNLTDDGFALENYTLPDIAINIEQINYTIKYQVFDTGDNIDVQFWNWTTPGWESVHSAISFSATDNFTVDADDFVSDGQPLMVNMTVSALLTTQYAYIHETQVKWDLSQSEWNETFTGSENKTFWIISPKNSSVVNMQLNLTGNSTVTNVYLLVNGTAVFNQTGNHTTENRTANFSTQVNNELLQCTADSDGLCYVSMLLHSDTNGNETISAINKTYIYNTSYLYDITINNITPTEVVVDLPNNFTTSLANTGHNTSVNTTIHGFHTMNFSNASTCGINDTAGTVHQGNNCTITLTINRSDEWDYVLWENRTVNIEMTVASCPAGFTNQTTYCEKVNESEGMISHHIYRYINTTSNDTKIYPIVYRIPMTNLSDFNGESYSYSINGSSTSLTDVYDDTEFNLTVGTGYSTSSLYEEFWEVYINYKVSPAGGTPPPSSPPGPSIPPTVTGQNFSLLKPNIIMVVCPGCSGSVNVEIDSKFTIPVTPEFICDSSADEPFLLNMSGNIIEKDICDYVSFPTIIEIPAGKIIPTLMVVSAPLETVEGSYDYKLRVKMLDNENIATVTVIITPLAGYIGKYLSWFQGCTILIPSAVNEICVPNWIITFLGIIAGIIFLVIITILVRKLLNN